MKKFIIPLILILFTGFTSCDVAQLDIPQHGVIEVGATYENASDDEIISLIAAVYYKVHGDSYADNFGQSMASAYSMKYHLERMGGDFAEYFQYNETAESSTYKKIWSYYYTTIYWCNMIIEKLPNNKIASQVVIKQVIAEARTIRAISMMYLVQLYGTPPLADHILNGSEGNTPAEKSWAFINTELAEAAEALPSKVGVNGQAAIGGRLTKEAAYAYLGKAYLWQKNYIEAAKVLYNKVIATNLYALVSDFNELNRYTSDFCSEYLWEYDKNNSTGVERSQAGLFDLANFNWEAGNIYIPDKIYSVAGWGKTACPSEAFGSFMDKHDATANGTKTPRYRGTLATYEDLLDESLYTYSNGNKGIKSTSVDNSEGYFRVKLIPRVENIMGDANAFQYQYMKNNLCFMRYAEVLLNYAEAVAMGGTEGTLTGLKALNLVRKRAGLGDAPSLDMNNTEYGVKAERRAELLFEGSRFIDLVRWGDASSELSKCGTYTPNFYGYIDGNNSTPQEKSKWKVIKTQTVGNGFKAGKNELFPIPSVDKNNNPNLVQNPGW
jgi:hypothetical protein